MILVGTRDGFHAVGDDAPRRLAGHRMTAVAQAGGDLWAVSDGESIWRRPPGGDWEMAAKLGGHRANCLLPAAAGLLVGASEASLFRLVAGELERVQPFDEAPGRDQWYTPWGGPPDVRSMDQGPNGPVYVNVHVGGVVVSADGAAPWRDTMDIDADVHQVVADPDRPGHAYAASARGMGVTTDAAASWRFDTGGLHSAYCRAVAVGGGMVYLSASAGSGGRRAGLYRRPVGDGGDFERCTGGLPEWFSTNLDTFCLAARPGLAVAGDADGTVYASEDDGATWEVAAGGLPGVYCVAITG